MKEIKILKRQLLKRVLGIIGVCSASLMTTCAKYGTIISNIPFSFNGTVRSKSSLNLIRGIEVKLKDGSDYKTLTDNSGSFSLNAEINEYDNSVYLHISDIDGTNNGRFLPKDTLMTLSQDEKLAQSKVNIDIRLKPDEKR